MGGEDFQPEELLVSVAVGLPLHGLYLVVGALQRAGGDRAIVPGEQALAVEYQRLGERFEHPDPGLVGASDPIVQEAFGFPEWSKYSADVQVSIMTALTRSGRSPCRPIARCSLLPDAANIASRNVSDEP